jgi:hypothetical protein
MEKKHAMEFLNGHELYKKEVVGMRVLFHPRDGGLYYQRWTGTPIGDHHAGRHHANLPSSHLTIHAKE